MSPLNNLDFEIRSSILTLLGAQSATTRMGAFLTEDFVVCSDINRVVGDLSKPQSPQATRDLESLSLRIGIQEAPRFSSGGTKWTETCLCFYTSGIT